MSKVRWLHFSDLHMNIDGVETKVMREKLLRYLADEKLWCDYVFFSGDLRNAPDGEFPKDMVEYLKKIVETVGGTPEKTFIVPGNHDIVREDKERVAAIKRMHFNGNKEDKSSSVECKKDFRREFNSFDLFIEQLIVFISSAKVSSYKVGTFYKNFCADNALILLADNV